MTFPKTPGVYEIRNVLSGRRYIGSSSTGLRRRIDAHKFCLRHNKHGNIRLQRAWNRDGEAAFQFILLAQLEKDEALPAEQRLLDEANASGEVLYNFGKVAGAASLGLKASPEARANMAAAQVRRNLDPEQRKSRSNSMKRALSDPAMRKKWSENRKKEWANPEYYAAQSERMRRITRDPAVRAKMSASRTGRAHSAETRENMRKAQAIACANPVRSKKLSDNIKARWSDPDQRKKLIAAITAGHAKRAA